MRDSRTGLAAAAVIGVLGIVVTAPSSHQNSYAQLPDLGVGLTSTPESGVQLGSPALTRLLRPSIHTVHAVVRVAGRDLPAAAPTITQASRQTAATPAATTTRTATTGKRYRTAKASRPDVTPAAPSAATPTKAGDEQTTAVDRFVTHLQVANTAAGAEATTKASADKTPRSGRAVGKHQSHRKHRGEREKVDKHLAKHARHK